MASFFYLCALKAGKLSIAIIRIFKENLKV